MTQVPRSPLDEIEGFPYFLRLCDKARLFHQGRLREDFHANLGRAMDLWTCQFLGVDYDEITRRIAAGESDQSIWKWATTHGLQRPEHERKWFLSYLTHCGFRDGLSQRLVERKTEGGWADRHDIQTFFDYMEVDEGRRD